MSSQTASARGSRNALLGLALSCALCGTASCSETLLRSAQGALAVSSTRQLFDITGVGGQRTSHISLTNRGRAPIRVEAYVPPPFYVPETITIPGGAEVPFEIRFSPDRTGSVTKTLQLATDDGQPAIAIELDGMANDVSICPAASNSCEQVTFVPDEGRCDVSPLPDDSPCEDTCLKNAVCRAGLCTEATRSCDDGLRCTIDTCDETRGCTHTPSESGCANPCMLPVCDEKGCREVPRADGEACGPATCAWDAICLNAACKHIERPDPLGTNHCNSTCMQGCAIRDFELGEDYVCLVKQDGSVWCKGRSVDAITGALFFWWADRERERPWAKEWVRVQGLPPVLELDVTTWTSPIACAISESGDVYCWGSNDAERMRENELGILGTQDFSNVVSPPRQVPGLKNATSISIADGTICASLADGTAWCWGRNLQSEAGTGSQDMVSSPAQVPLPVPVKQVAAGMMESCALTRAGDVWCWGEEDGTLLNSGLPFRQFGLPPQRITYLSDVDAIWFDPSSHAVLNGRMRDGRGVVAMGGGAPTYHPPPTYYPPSRGFFEGLGFAARILPDGTVLCSGGNNRAQLANGTTTGDYDRWGGAASPYSSNIVPGISDAQWLESSFGDRCVGRADGSVWCWGWNNAYVAGAGWLPPIDMSPATSPRQLPY